MERASLAAPRLARPLLAVRALETLPRTSVYVFCNDSGGPLHPGTVYHALRRVLATAGLPRISFHGLRHSFASALVASGAHPRALQQLLGHATVRLSLEVYAHVGPALERQAVEQMDALLG